MFLLWHPKWYPLWYLLLVLICCICRGSSGSPNSWPKSGLGGIVGAVAFHAIGGSCRLLLLVGSAWPAGGLIIVAVATSEASSPAASVVVVDADVVASLASCVAAAALAVTVSVAVAVVDAVRWRLWPRCRLLCHWSRPRCLLMAHPLLALCCPLLLQCIESLSWIPVLPCHRWLLLDRLSLYWQLRWWCNLARICCGWSCIGTTYVPF